MLYVCAVSYTHLDVYKRQQVDATERKNQMAVMANTMSAEDYRQAEEDGFSELCIRDRGASGAELANIINEAALRAVRSGRTVVNESDLEESIEVVIAGYQKKNAVLSDQEKKVVAYHEIGHALVAALQSHSAPVQKITIIPRTSVSYTHLESSGISGFPELHCRD